MFPNTKFALSSWLQRLAFIVALLFFGFHPSLAQSDSTETDSLETVETTEADSTTEISDNPRIYVFNIKEEIAPPIWRLTKLALERAREQEVDLIFIHMNTYGGLVDAADSIRTAILNCPIPVYILVENNAASAGALISIACDKIFMMPGSTIGAATVVNQNGEQVPDKYQSYMRKKMRATAEETGRNPDIAEGMVDPDVVVPGISEKGKVITFTTKEAVENNYCDGVVSTMGEALEMTGVEEYEVVRHEVSGTDSIIGWLINPAISGILILIIIGGIYFELQSPGVGFPLIAAFAAALLYFAPLYVEGLAENWEIALFVVGIILIAVEIFVIPGFGVAGIAGIACTVTGLAFSMVGNIGFDFTVVNGPKMLEAFLIVLLSSATSVFGSVFLGYKMISSGGPLSRFVLQSVQKKEEGFVISQKEEKGNMVGREGIAATVLRPGGKIEMDGRLYDAAAESGFIDAGSNVVVVASDTSSLIVRVAAG